MISGFWGVEVYSGGRGVNGEAGKNSRKMVRDQWWQGLFVFVCRPSFDDGWKFDHLES